MSHPSSRGANVSRFPSSSPIGADASRRRVCRHTIGSLCGAAHRSASRNVPTSTARSVRSSSQSIKSSAKARLSGQLQNSPIPIRLAQSKSGRRGAWEEFSPCCRGQGPQPLLEGVLEADSALSR
jgi:hypothetical protein